jgi:very-short-patch-repair endonuclease
MPAPEPPLRAKPPAATAIRRSERLEAAVGGISRIAHEVWRVERVCGFGDSEVTRIAEVQRGVIHREQLIEAGIGRDAIQHRLRTGYLHKLYRSVYVVGRPRLEPLATATAAVMQADGRGVLGHRTFGAIWGMTEAPESPVELTVVGNGMRSRRGLIVHRVNSLSPADVRLCKGLPGTSPARTLVDLAGVLTVDELESALAIARRRNLASDQEIHAAIARAPHAKGVATLRKLLSEGKHPRLTRSKYERKLLKLLSAAQLPKPVPNAKVEGHEVDLLWPQHRLVVEFDSVAFHMDRKAFEQDRLRDQRLTAAGYRVLRITARQLDTTPEAVVARIAQALAHGNPHGIAHGNPSHHPN